MYNHRPDTFICLRDKRRLPVFPKGKTNKRLTACTCYSVVYSAHSCLLCLQLFTVFTVLTAISEDFDKTGSQYP